MAKEKSKNKKAIVVLIILLLIAAIVIGGILAYFTDTDTATNIFTIGDVQIALHEQSWDPENNATNIIPGATIAKDPTVENTGANDAYVFVEVKIPCIDTDGDGNVEQLFNFNTNNTPNAGWTIINTPTIENGEITYVLAYATTSGNTTTMTRLNAGATTSTAAFSNVTFASTLIGEVAENIANTTNVAHKTDIIVNAYGIQADSLTESTPSDIFALFAAENSGSGTTVADITTDNYGQYIDIGTSLLDLENITLSDNSHPQADWQVFYKDANGVWLILSDYLPVDSGTGASVVSTVGLETDGENYEYSVWPNDDREDLISKLNGNWSGLITGSDVAGETGVLVKGAVDLPTWVASWNSNTGYTHLYYENITEPDNNNFYGTGYGISDTEPVESYYVDVSSDTGYNNTLYFPHQSDVSNCYGYWLASPSASNDDCVGNVYYYGNVDGNLYDDCHCGVRPAVYLPSNISLDTTGAVWSIAE